MLNKSQNFNTKILITRPTPFSCSHENGYPVVNKCMTKSQRMDDEARLLTNAEIKRWGRLLKKLNPYARFR